MKLNKKYILTSKEKEKIQEFNNLFHTNGHELLNGKKINKKTANEIESFYQNKLGNIQIGWGSSLLDIELEDLKKDNICKNNSNKKQWIMSYMLQWLADLPIKADTEYFYNHLTTREANRELIKTAYGA